MNRGWVRHKQPIHVDVDDDACERPIMIIGTHRSGTSLLRRVVDSHPSVACPPESFFLTHYAAALDDPLTGDGLAGMGFEGEAAKAGIQRGAVFFHEAYRRAQGKARWADETPAYAERLPTLARLLPTGTQSASLRLQNADFGAEWGMSSSPCRPMRTRSAKAPSTSNEDARRRCPGTIRLSHPAEHTAQVRPTQSEEKLDRPRRTK